MYEETEIKFKFKENIILSARFSPLETVKDLYDFVKQVKFNRNIFTEFVRPEF